jgi:hypothetical protein
MFRSTTIIRELVLKLAKVIFILKHPVKLRRYMLFGDVAAGRRNFTECLNINITLSRLSTSSLMMVVDRNMLEGYFMCILCKF